METLTKTNWSDYKGEREDILAIPMMLRNGFELEFSHQDTMYNRTDVDNIPVYEVGFKRGDYHVWEIKSGWQTASLITHRFTNHKSYKTIEETL